ncbi:MAG: homocysteine S-methyltransferase family protein [Actinobacteria bacterium]|nr:MAG: homocysteine S-methyltransferase family protein [Actinomycetota bacterium]
MRSSIHSVPRPEEADVSKGILERLAEGPVLGDGGYLLELEKRGYVQAGPFTPEVVIEHPDALAQLHREFLRAGAEVLQTMTFYASDDKLATVGLAGKVDEINRDAVGIARKVAAEGDALVAGNLSLTWAYDPADPKSADHVRELFDRQLQDQLDAGPPDFWIGETFSFTAEALLFVERAKATGLPVMATMCFETARRNSSRSPSRWWRRWPVPSPSPHSPSAMRRRMPKRTSRHGPSSRTDSPPRRSREESWRRSPPTRATRVSATSAPVAVRSPNTFARWPR